MNEIIRIKGELPPETREIFMQVSVASEEDLIRIAKAVGSPIIDSTRSENEVFTIDGNKRILYTFTREHGTPTPH